MDCTTEGSAEGWKGVAVVGGLGVRVTGRPVREELVEKALEEELAELEELEELEEPPKGDGEARLVRASRGYYGVLLISRGSGPSSGSMAWAPVLGFPCDQARQAVPRSARKL